MSSEGNTYSFHGFVKLIKLHLTPDFVFTYNSTKKSSTDPAACPFFEQGFEQISRRVHDYSLNGEDLRRGRNETNREDCVWIGINHPHYALQGRKEVEGAAKYPPTHLHAYLDIWDCYKWTS